MALSLNECMNKLKDAHPDLYPVSYVEDRGKYLFNLLKRGANREEAPANFFVIDPANGQIAGPIPSMIVYDNDHLAEKLEHPHMVSGEDQKPPKVIHCSMEHDGPFLSHHGIIGQKWGVRRFQNKDGTLTAEGRKRYGVGTEVVKEKLKEKGIEPKKTETAEPAKSPKADKPPERKLTFRERSLTREAKAAESSLNLLEFEAQVDRTRTKENDSGKRYGERALFYALTLNPLGVADLAAHGVMSAVAKAKVNKYMTEREENSEKDPKTGLYLKKDGQYDEKQDLAAVNPGYLDMNSNSKNNCMLCTTTYELRKRGYDVTAQLDSVGYSFPDLKRWYPKAKVERISRFNEDGIGISKKEYMAKTINALEKQGNGAHGNVMVCWNAGGAHSVYYEVQNGKVIFKDGQTGKTYLNPEKLLINTRASSYARLDNVKPDMKKIKEECVR